MAGLTFGVRELQSVTGAVHGQVFDDTNRNGVHDGGARPEGPAAGVTVELVDGSGASRTTVTDAHGAYRFDGVPGPSAFRVRQVLGPAERQTLPADPAGYAGAITTDGQDVALPEFGHAAGPDVLITAAVRENEDEEVKWSYSASGPAAAISVALFRSANETFGADDVPVATPLTVRIPGGGTVNGDLKFALKGFKHDPKRPYLLVVVDPKKAVRELDETNNVRTVERKIDLDPLHVTGDFKYDPPADAFRSTGLALIGFKPAAGGTFYPMVRADGAVSYTADRIDVNGTVAAVNDLDGEHPLFEGQWALDPKTGKSLSLTTPREFDLLSLGGRFVELTQVSLARTSFGPVVEVRGGLDFPFLESTKGRLDGVKVRIDGPNAIRIGSAGVSLSGKVLLPRVKTELPGGVEADVQDVTMEYLGRPLNAFKFQGKIGLGKLFKTAVGAEGDFTGESYIQYGRDGWKVVGSVALSDVPLGGSGATLRKIKLSFDSTKEEWHGDGELKFPPLTQSQTLLAGFGMEFGEVNYLSLGFDHGNFRIGAGPWYLQKVQGQVDKLADPDPNNPEFAGTVGFSFLPEWNGSFFELAGLTWLPFDPKKIDSAALGRVDLTAKWNAAHIQGTGQVKLLTEKFLTLTGDVDFVYADNTSKTKGTLNLLDGVLTGQGSMTVDGNAVTVVGSATGTLRLPTIPRTFIQGQEIAAGNGYLNVTVDDNSANDYVVFYAAIRLPVLGTKTAGFKLAFDGTTQFLNGMGQIQSVVGMGPTPAFAAAAAPPAGPPGEFAVPAGVQQLLLTADWDTDVGPVPVEIEGPDGTVYTPATWDAERMGVIDFFSGPTRTAVAVLNPEPGTWKIRVPAAGLGEVRYEAQRETNSPTATVDAAAVAANAVTLDYTAADADSAAEVTLFYGTDPDGLVGTPITSFTETDGPGQYVWDTTGVPEGTYHVWARVEDGTNAPVVAMLAGTVMIDHTPPTILGVDPVGSTGTSAVVVRFAEAMAPAAADAAHYDWRAAGRDGKLNTADDVVIPVTAAYDAAGRRATLTPTTPKPPADNTMYTLSVRGLADAGGNPMAPHHETFGRGTRLGFKDADGESASVSLTGPGRLLVRLADADGDGRGAVASAAVTDATAEKSAVTVAVTKLKAGDGLIAVGEVTAAGLKSLSAPKADLVGRGVAVAGRLGSLRVHDVRDGAAVTAGGAPTAATKVTAHHLWDGTNLTVGGRLTLTAARVGRGTVTAPAVAGLTVTGDKAAGLAADFLADLTVTGGADLLLDKVKVNGSVAGATWVVAGNVGSVSVGAFTDSQLSAGFTPDPTGLLTGAFTDAFTITQFTVTGVRGVTAPAFANSEVAAAAVTRVTLASAAADNAGRPHGFVTRAAIKTVTVKGLVLAPDPDTPADRAAGDFRLRVV